MLTHTYVLSYKTNCKHTDACVYIYVVIYTHTSPKWYAHTIASVRCKQGCCDSFVLSIVSPIAKFDVCVETVARSRCCLRGTRCWGGRWVGLARALKIGGVFECLKECTENAFVHDIFSSHSIEEHKGKWQKKNTKLIKGKYVSEKIWKKKNKWIFLNYSLYIYRRYRVIRCSYTLLMCHLSNAFDAHVQL